MGNSFLLQNTEIKGAGRQSIESGLQGMCSNQTMQFDDVVVQRGIMGVVASLFSNHRFSNSLSMNIVRKIWDYASTQLNKI